VEDFTGYNGVETLIKTLNRQLNEVCVYYNIKIEENEFIGDRFARIITELSQKINNVVVVLRYESTKRYIHGSRIQST